MNDLIDRQAAIDAVQRHREGVLGGYEYDEGVAFVYAAAHNHIIDVIKQLPSAQPDKNMIHLQKEQAYMQGWEDGREALRKGKWVIEDCHAATYKYCCSNCHAHHRARYDYCPSCGADMRGEQNG